MNMRLTLLTDNKHNSYEDFPVIDLQAGYLAVISKWGDYGDEDYVGKIVQKNGDNLIAVGTSLSWVGLFQEPAIYGAKYRVRVLKEGEVLRLG
jgi:hypothetical protein